MALRSNAAFAIVESEERRVSDRVDVAIWGRVRLRGTAHPLRICNISGGGFMAVTPASLPDYAEVDVEFPVIGWRSAMIAWTRGDQIGAEFEPPLPHALLARFLAFQAH
jgi:PilZ domain